MKIVKDPDREGVIHVTSERPGPRVVMFSGVHGDEVSGIHAIEKTLFDFFGGKRSLLRGSLTLVRANEAAIVAERRYVKHNMNRMFRDSYGADVDTTSYEFRRTQELKKVLEHCDYFLDFHSAPIADLPFLVAEQQAVEFYRRLGIPRIMTGWSKFSGGAIGGDAENFANSHGATSATLESGSHFDKSSNDVAYTAATSLLSLLEMIPDAPPTAAEAEIFDMYAVVIKDFDDFRYADDTRNFKFIPKGEGFAVQNGQPVRVAEDSYLLIPMKADQTKVHEEVGYLGRKVRFEPAKAA